MRFRYYNSIMWGDDMDACGAHHLEAATPQEAFAKANRADKDKLGLSFLQVETSPGKWEWIKEA